MQHIYSVQERIKAKQDRLVAWQREQRRTRNEKIQETKQRQQSANIKSMKLDTTELSMKNYA